jgi:hypothetical protein
VPVIPVFQMSRGSSGSGRTRGAIEFSRAQAALNQFGVRTHTAGERVLAVSLMTVAAPFFSMVWFSAVRPDNRMVVVS